MGAPLMLSSYTSIVRSSVRTSSTVTTEYLRVLKLDSSVGNAAKVVQSSD
jgi:hypothetical protein